jgi:hypothetical protein
MINTFRQHDSLHQFVSSVECVGIDFVLVESKNSAALLIESDLKLTLLMESSVELIPFLVF